MMLLVVVVRVPLVFLIMLALGFSLMLVRMFALVTTLGCGEFAGAWRAGDFDHDASLAFPAVVNCFGKRLVSRPEFDR